jgi:hypothetical protein
MLPSSGYTSKEGGATEAVFINVSSLVKEERMATNDLLKDDPECIRVVDIGSGCGQTDLDLSNFPKLEASEHVKEARMIMFSPEVDR